MKDKDLYKLFNHVKIKEIQNDSIEEISEMQKERIKKNLNKKIKRKKRRKTIKYSGIAAALALVALIGVNTFSPSFAEDIPVIGSVVQMLNERIGIHGDYEEYSQIVDKSITKKGITVTINEVLADESRLMVGYTIKSDSKLNLGDGRFQDYMDLTADFKVNGKYLHDGGSGLGQYIDDYTYVGSEVANVSLMEIPEEFNVDLKISNIMDTKARWNFAFSASKEKITKNTRIFEPELDIDFPDSLVTVHRVEFSPIGTYISLSGDYKIEPDEFSNGIFEYEHWIAYDDNGVELATSGMAGGTRGGNGSKDFYSETEYEKVDEIPEYLTILPLKIIPSGGGGVMYKGGKEIAFETETKEAKEVSQPMDGVYPKELLQGEFGKLVINEVIKDNNKTLVKLKAKGKARDFQAKSLRIKDGKGEIVGVGEPSLRKGNKNSNEFILEFDPLEPSKEYYLTTTDFSNIEFDESMEFKIQLQR